MVQSLHSFLFFERFCTYCIKFTINEISLYQIRPVLYRLKKGVKSRVHTVRNYSLVENFSLPSSPTIEEVSHIKIEVYVFS